MSESPHFKIGDTASLTKTFTQQDVDSFAELSMDKNPLHVDEEAASKSIFGKRVIHGILQTGLISAVLGNQLPGPGSIYREQQLVFKKPAFPGDTLTAKVEVIEINERIGIIICRTTVKNQNGDLLINGKAKGIIDKIKN
ncbi:MAG: MaoC family dehydratase [Candidatus Aureabacteria bacterium]|nr:MaoC family dehydratase [Candidatus Auribacterota bacterium]